LTRELRCAEIVVKSFMKKRISTGAAGHIEATMEEKCGGVVESKVKTRLVASTRSTSAKRTMRMKMMITIRKKIRLSISNT
jgi:hypothetical protein